MERINPMPSAADPRIGACDKARREAIVQLQHAMGAMCGRAPFASLGQIHQIAVEQFGFAHPLEDALGMLAELPNVEVQPADAIEETKVSGPDYWAL